MTMAILDTRVDIDPFTPLRADQNSKRPNSNNAAAESQWTKTEARTLSERSRAIPDAAPKITAPPVMRNH